MEHVLPIVREGLADNLQVGVLSVEPDSVTSRQSSTVASCVAVVSGGERLRVWVKVLHGGGAGSNVKVRRTIRDFDLTNHLRGVWGGEGACLVPPALFCSPADRLIVTGHMDGVRFQDKLMRLGQEDGMDIDELAADLRRCGEWLAAFQRATRGYCPGGAEGGAEGIVKGFPRIIEQTGGRFGEALRGPVGAMVGVRREAVFEFIQARGRMLEEDEDVCAVHGDFFPGNLLINGRQVVGIDFSSSTWGTPWFDLAYFVYQFETLLRSKGVGEEVEKRLRKAFLEGAGKAELSDDFWHCRPELEILLLAQHASRLLALTDSGRQPLHRRAYRMWRARRLGKEIASFLDAAASRGRAS